MCILQSMHLQSREVAHSFILPCGRDVNAATGPGGILIGSGDKAVPKACMHSEWVLQ